MKDFEKNFENALSIRLTKVEKSEMFEQPDLAKLEKSPLMEFHVSKAMRDKCDFDLSLFATTGNVILTNFKNVRLFAKKINDQFDPVLESSKMVKAGQLNAMGLIDEIFHYVCQMFRKQANAKAFEQMVKVLDEELGKEKVDKFFKGKDGTGGYNGAAMSTITDAQNNQNSQTQKKQGPGTQEFGKTNVRGREAGLPD